MAILRNIEPDNKEAYQYLGANVLKNIRSGVQRELSDEEIKANYKISPELTILFNDYPLITELVRRLDLKIEKI